MIISGQEVAHEGIMAGYAEGRSMKFWETLEKFVGVQVPVSLEHPVDQLGNGVFFSDAVSPAPKRVGTATLFKCPEKRALCANIEVDEGTPLLGGYSIGYEVAVSNNPGEFDGEEYACVHEITAIDHIALTSSPRDSSALMRADSAERADGNSRYFYKRALSDSISPTAHAGGEEEEMSEEEEGGAEAPDLASMIAELTARVGELAALVEALAPAEPEADAAEEAEEEERTDSAAVAQLKSTRAELAKVKAERATELGAQLEQMGYDASLAEGASANELKKMIEIARSKPRSQRSRAGDSETEPAERSAGATNDPNAYKYNPATGRSERITAGGDQ